MKVLLCAVFLFLFYFSIVGSSISQEFLVNITYSPEVFPNAENKALYSIHCFIPSERFTNGDIINVSVDFCTSNQTVCKPLTVFPLLYAPNCRKSVEVSYRLFANIGSADLVTKVKRFDERFYTTIQVSGITAIQQQNLSLLQPLPQQSRPVAFSFFSLPVLALILILIGIVLLIFRKAAGIVFVLIGIIMLIASLFFG